MEFVTGSDAKHPRVSKHTSESMEVSFPIFPTTAPKSTNPTKINIIVSNIPLSTARIANLGILSLGVSLNFLIVSVILLKPSMRTSMNIYVVSLVCSNMVILMEPFEEIMRWFFDVQTKLNMDYVCLVSFNVSVVTIAVLKFQLYITIFQQDTRFGEPFMKRFTAVKGTLLVWSSSTITLAIELHIFDFFEGDVADMYVWNTFMFIAVPFVIFVALDSLILYQLMLLKDKEGSWRSAELRQFFMLVITAVAFFLVRTPYRLARAINFMVPKASCCTDSKREVLYFMAKMFPIVFAIIYIALSREFRAVLQVFRKCRKSVEESVVI